MPVRRLRQLRSEESGFALIEILISALIVVMITAAVVQTLTATGRASTEQRRRSQAFSVAQEDQVRLRAMKISSLQQGLPSRVVTVDGTPFTVTSTATYVSDSTGTMQCGGQGKADYVQIGSNVTWPTMRQGAAPIEIESIVSPTSGSVDATSGGLAISILNSRSAVKGENGIAGVPLSGSGPATFFGTTNSQGCALFGGEPVGKYTVTPTLSGPGWVDVNGLAPHPFTASVSGGTTQVVEEHYDHAGEIEAIFTARLQTGLVEPATADSIMAFNPAISPRSFGSPGAGLQTFVKAAPLYPFETGYSIWGGSCMSANSALAPAEAAKATSIVAPGGINKGVKVRLPALYTKVMTGSSTLVGGALVTVTDLNCTTSSKTPVVRKYRTTKIGALGGFTAKETEVPVLETPGIPTGEYEVCASKAGRKYTVKSVVVKSVAGTSVTMNLTGTGSEPGVC